MNFKVAVVGLLASASSVSAFSPKAFGIDSAKIIRDNKSIRSTDVDPSQHPALWIPPKMKMVAGGAERAYGDDYYDGMDLLRIIFYGRYTFSFKYSFYFFSLVISNHVRCTYWTSS